MKLAIDTKIELLDDLTALHSRLTNLLSTFMHADSSSRVLTNPLLLPLQL
jgi:hypothetical protein